MNGHLIAIKVGVKRSADQGVKLDSFAFDQDRFKRLNAQTVQRWSTVQHDGMFADNLVQDIPNFLALLFNPLLGLLQSHRQTLCIKTRIDERFEQFERHLLWQAALMQFQFRARHDDRTT